MAYGLNTYLANGTASFEMSDRVTSIVYRITPANGSSGSVVMPNVTTVTGLMTIVFTYTPLNQGGGGFRTTLTEPNILSWSPSYSGGIIPVTSGQILVVTKNE